VGEHSIVFRNILPHGTVHREAHISADEKRFRSATLVRKYASRGCSLIRSPAARQEDHT
jgi:hypothetical protein